MELDFLLARHLDLCQSTCFQGGTDIAEGLSEEGLYNAFSLVRILCPSYHFPSDMKEHG